MLPYDMNHAMANQRMDSLHQEASNHRQAIEAGLISHPLRNIANAIRKGFAEMKDAASRPPEFNGPIQPAI